MGIDVIGSREKAVAIVELKAGEKAKEKAAAVMKQHKNVRSVLAKASPRYGKYRKRRLRLIAGSKNTEVTHIESGMRFRVDPRRAYFSPREATERMRVASAVKQGEDVCVFFAGVGPFAIAIAKKAKPRSVIGVEINPAAVRYFRENVRINKVSGLVEAIKGDVTAVKLKKKFDRIVMPLPEKAISYLPHALAIAKKGCVIHMYAFCEEGREKEIIEKVKTAAKASKQRIRLLRARRVLPYAARVWKMRFDVEVL